MIPVVWLSYKEEIPARGYWDQGMVEDLLNNRIWRTGYEFTHLTGLDGLEGAVVVFPARAQVESVDRLNEELSKLKWAVLLLTGDEEALFPVEQITHPNIRIWVMSPRPGRHDKFRKLGTGYPPHLRLPECAPEKTLDYFFAGQITHDRRRQMAEKLRVMSGGEHVETEGFIQGLEPTEYYKKLASAKVAPCPSGPETPDTFRLFEALETGCIPIADTRTPKGDFLDDYWTFFFGEEPPFPVLTNYEQLPGYTQDAVERWKPLSNTILAWWVGKKRQMALDLQQDVFETSGINPNTGKITVLIPTSPIAAHPNTELIERTITDVRSKLDCEIIVMIDGIREEQAHYSEQYQEYIGRLLWLCKTWGNVLPILSRGHQHQAGMTRDALKYVKTPTILFVEHDAPITPDYDFPWDNFVEAITEGGAEVVRFHHEARILPEHEHLMFDKEPIQVCGVPMKRTMQWSQRPHLASTAFYRHILNTFFHPESRTMIEDVMHGIVDTACKEDGIMGWHNFRVWIYTPEGNIKRSYHLDGRGDDPKYEMDIRPVNV